MPTGYTENIAKGISFKEYALQCARAFSPLITMKDEPLDAEIPDEFQADDYHAKALKTAEKNLLKFQNMDLQEAEKLMNEEYEAEVLSLAERIQEKQDLKEKYELMLSQVKAYTPPTPDHIRYKEFMIEQIESSIEWDCNLKHETPPIKKDVKQWISDNIECAKHDIEYHTKCQKEEVEKTLAHNAWIKALKKSLQ